MTSLPLLLLAFWSGAAEMKAPAPVGLHPLLLGDPSAAASPLTGALVTQAADLRLAGRGGPMTASMAAAVLAPALAGPEPLPRAAALVSAKLMADRSAAESFLAARPGLAEGPVASLRGLAVPDDAYRGHAADPRTPLGALAAAAVSDPATAWLFDGTRPGLDLGFLSLDGRMLKGYGRHVKLSKGGDSFSGAHPDMPGAALTLVPATASSFQLQAERRLYETLGEAGASPRWLGEGRVRREDRKPVFLAAGVREAVEGETVRSLMDSRRYHPEDHALVLQLLHLLLDRRLAVAGLGPESIVLGRTAAEPARRAYVVGAAGVEPMPEGTTAEEAWRRVHETPVFMGVESGSAGGELILRPAEIWQPLSMVLSAGVRRPGPTVAQRLASWLRLKR